MKPLLLFILLTYYAETFAFDEGEVNFCIFASNPQNVTYKDFMMLPETGFNKDLPTVFVVHGFQSGYQLLDLFREAYGSDLEKKLNLIGIDWSKGSSTWYYPTAVERTPTVGSAVGQFIMDSIKNNLISDPYSIHVIGHSLGAHIAGFIGKHMANSGPNKIKLRHITALDPAGPYIGSYECPKRLCETDATFVETLHTNGGTLGMWPPIGSLDLYVNGGSSQPGCWIPTCSHSFSHEWYRTVMKGTPPTDGWLCDDLKQMETEKFCKKDGNPRDYLFEILETKPRELGIVYLPTTPAFAARVPNITQVFTDKPDDYTIVFIGSNAKNVVLLASLLSDDGHLVVQRQNDEVIVINPTNHAWQPDPKYHICHEVLPDRIPNCLKDVKKPIKFVVAFDATDMFTDEFWNMLFYLAEYESQDKVYSNQLEMVAMDVPHDGITLKQHTDELKSAMDNAFKTRYDAVFQMAAMHMIKKSGVVKELPELESELVDIKNEVDN